MISTETHIHFVHDEMETIVHKTATYVSLKFQKKGAVGGGQCSALIYMTSAQFDQLATDLAQYTTKEQEAA